MRYLVGLVMLFMVLSLIAGVSEMTYLSAGVNQATPLTGSNVTSRIDKLLFEDIEWQEVKGLVAVGIVLVKNAPSWFENLWNMIWFNYAMFQGSWQIVRWILFVPIGVGIVWMVLSWARGTSG